MLIWTWRRTDKAPSPGAKWHRKTPMHLLATRHEHLVQQRICCSLVGPAVGVGQKVVPADQHCSRTIPMCCINLYANITLLSALIPAQIAEWYVHKDLCNQTKPCSQAITLHWLVTAGVISGDWTRNLTVLLHKSAYHTVVCAYHTVQLSVQIAEWYWYVHKDSCNTMFSGLGVWVSPDKKTRKGVSLAGVCCVRVCRWEALGQVEQTEPPSLLQPTWATTCVGVLGD